MLLGSASSQREILEDPEEEDGNGQFQHYADDAIVDEDAVEPQHVLDDDEYDDAYDEHAEPVDEEETAQHVDAQVQ